MRKMILALAVLASLVSLFDSTPSFVLASSQDEEVVAENIVRSACALAKQWIEHPNSDARKQAFEKVVSPDRDLNFYRDTALAVDEARKGNIKTDDRVYRIGFVNCTETGRCTVNVMWKKGQHGRWWEKMFFVDTNTGKITGDT